MSLDVYDCDMDALHEIRREIDCQLPLRRYTSDVNHCLAVFDQSVRRRQGPSVVDVVAPCVAASIGERLLRGTLPMWLY